MSLRIKSENTLMAWQHDSETKIVKHIVDEVFLGTSFSETKTASHQESSEDIDARFIDAMALTDDKKATGKPADASNLETSQMTKIRQNALKRGCSAPSDSVLKFLR